MPISVYNYDVTKIPFLLALDAYLRADLKGSQYYYDSDWQQGPNTMLVLGEESNELELVRKVEAFSEKYMRHHPLSEEQVAQKMAKYKKIQEPLRKLELREETENANLSAHGYVCKRSKKEGVYNSDYHEKVFFDFRCRLNKINLILLPYFAEMNEVQRNKLFFEMFKYIATLFEHGAEYGYLSFLSHAQGFFSRLKNETSIVDMKEKFEQTRLFLFEESTSEIPDQVSVILEDWKALWAEIAVEMKQDFRRENYNEQARLTLEQQLQILDENISDLGNSFHKSLQEYHKETDILNSDEVIVYRDIVNLFYLTLPVFEQSMLKKQFFAYSTVRYYETVLENEAILSFD